MQNKNPIAVPTIVRSHETCQGENSEAGNKTTDIGKRATLPVV